MSDAPKTAAERAAELVTDDGSDEWGKAFLFGYPVGGKASLVRAELAGHFAKVDAGAYMRGVVEQSEWCAGECEAQADAAEADCDMPEVAKALRVMAAHFRDRIRARGK